MNDTEIVDWLEKRDFDANYDPTNTIDPSYLYYEDDDGKDQSASGASLRECVIKAMGEENE